MGFPIVPSNSVQSLASFLPDKADKSNFGRENSLSPFVGGVYTFSWRVAPTPPCELLLSGEWPWPKSAFPARGAVRPCR
jgi:hypothetical protein